MATNNKAGKVGLWNNPDFLHDLVMCFYSAGTEAGVMTAEIRKDIEHRMKTLNHQVTWEGIRKATSFLLSVPKQRTNMAPHMRWDEKVHNDILLAVFQHVKFTSEQMGSIMADLSCAGYGFSESALRYLHSLSSHIRLISHPSSLISRQATLPPRT
ncbi:hypothetical protein E4U41_003806 [Claviceps citrina]|nr:hypothetical protein E4U41_003806 [Claviceps citrina]